MIMNWYDLIKENYCHGGRPSTSEAFKTYAIYNKKITYYFTSNSVGSVSFLNTKTPKQLIAELCNKLNCYVVGGEDTETTLFYSNDFFIEFTFETRNKQVEAYFISGSYEEGVITELKEILKSFFNFEEENNSKVYILVKSYDGIQPKSIGSFKKKLNKNNYSKNVLLQFRECINNIKKKKPNGRMTIIHGEPGTGKTYLLRSLINEIKDAIFISIPPETFKNYDASALVDALFQFKGQKLILLIEDADSILIDRGKNSEDIVSNVLNFTDGFMGECLDVHFVCTTNIGRLEIDEAYRRKGRLNKFISVDKLNTEESRIAYNGIKLKTKPKYEFTESMTLAEIYAIADSNIDEIKNNKRKIGFQL